MLEALLPPPQSRYRGSTLALWLFGVALLPKLLCGSLSLFAGRAIAPNLHRIPLSTFTPDAVRVSLALLALWGLAQVMISLVGVVVLARYRAAVPFMLALIVTEHLGRELLRHVLPLDPTAIPTSGINNLIVLGLALFALPLSLRRREPSAAPPAPAHV